MSATDSGSERRTTPPPRASTNHAIAPTPDVSVSLHYIHHPRNKASDPVKDHRLLSSLTTSI
ncbi:MAG: hypothetical protein KAT65_11260 [Methanophagales archaeon]|nr:hypothetical protein [Methanophagales archaeon]